MAVKVNFEKVVRNDVAEWQKLLECNEAQQKELVRLLNDPDRYIERQQKRIAEVEALLDLERNRLAQIRTNLDNADAKMAELRERREEIQLHKTARVKLELMTRMKKMFKEVKELGYDLGQMVKEEDIVS